MKCPYDPNCGIDLDSPAKTFLHRQLHREKFEWSGSLYQLPYSLMPRIAQLMQDYHDFMLQCECGEEQLEGWPCSAGFAPRLK